MRPHAVRRSVARLVLAGAFVAAAAPAAAQQAGAPAHAGHAAVDPAVRAEVYGVITGLFDAMRSRDTAALRAAFAPGAQLTTTGMRDGQPTVSNDAIDGWINSVGSAPAGLVLDERLYNEQVHVSDGLAAVWVEYDFYAGDRFSHCGVDAFVLVRTAGGWKVSSVADTRRREGCPTRGGAQG